MEPLVLFLIGLVTAVLWARAVSAVQDKRAASAGGYTVVLDLVTIGSTWWVVAGGSVPSLLAYSLGGGLGTFWVVRRSRR
jgi:hypothetical protein